MVNHDMGEIEFRFDGAIRINIWEFGCDSKYGRKQGSDMITFVF